MFEADSQNFASAPSVPRRFTLQNVRPLFGGDHRGTLGGGGVPAKPPSPPSDTSLREGVVTGGGGGLSAGPPLHQPSVTAEPKGAYGTTDEAFVVLRNVLYAKMAPSPLHRSCPM